MSNIKPDAFMIALQHEFPSWLNQQLVYKSHRRLGRYNQSPEWGQISWKSTRCITSTGYESWVDPGR